MYISESKTCVQFSDHHSPFRCVLVASSDYFEAMISRSGMQEATAGENILSFSFPSCETEGIVV